MARGLRCDALDTRNCSSATVGDGCRSGLMRQGRLQAQATGYDKPEHVRIEFVPGSGDVLEFVIANGKVDALVYDDLRFEKAR